MDPEVETDLEIGMNPEVETDPEDETNLELRKNPKAEIGPGTEEDLSASQGLDHDP